MTRSQLNMGCFQSCSQFLPNLVHHRRYPPSQMPASHSLCPEQFVGIHDESQFWHLECCLQQYCKSRSFSEVSALIWNETSLGRDFQLYRGLTGPRTVGSLALAYLCHQHCVCSAELASFSSQNAFLLARNLGSQLPDIRDFTLLLLCLVISPEAQSVKECFLRRGIIPVLLALFRAEAQVVRLMAAHCAASLYRRNEEGQRLFLRYRGEKQLVQLLKRDGDEDATLALLLTHIQDLIYVTPTQDEEDTLLEANYRLLFTPVTLDLLQTLGIERVVSI